MDRLWLLDSRVYPFFDAIDSVSYNYLTRDTENNLTFFERLKTERYSCLMMKYSVAKGNCSFIQSQSKINDSLYFVVQTTFSSNKMREQNAIFDQHMEILNSVIQK